MSCTAPRTLNVVDKMDWLALRKQKEWLLGSGSDEACGLVHLIDALQDAAVADGIAPYSTVFAGHEEPLVSVSIGHVRSDGDLSVLATLSNKDDDMDSVAFAKLIVATAETLRALTGHTIVVYEREDATDYAELSNSEEPLPL